MGFPQEEFENAELSMIDTDGNYIIKGRSFKNASFFEFYKSYNETDSARTGTLTKQVLTTSGSFTMDDSRGQRMDRPWAASIPIIAMTADAFPENVAACMDAGMNGHIAKPVDIKLVIKEIRRMKEEGKK